MPLRPRLIGPLVVLALTAALPATAAVTAWTTVAIRVYDGTGLPGATRAAALAHTAAVLAHAAIEPAWRLCGVTDQPAAPECGRPLGSGELAVRVVRGSVPAGAGRLPLGDAPVDLRAGRAVLATIYLERVLWLARAAATDPRALLGRAIAHEIGHLLMATAAHAVSGLMRPSWTREDLRRDRPGDWDFRPEEVARIASRRTSVAATDR